MQDPLLEVRGGAASDDQVLRLRSLSTTSCGADPVPLITYVLHVSDLDLNSLEGPTMPKEGQREREREIKNNSYGHLFCFDSRKPQNMSRL